MKCPLCGEQIDVRSLQPGQAVRCEKCRSEMSVPESPAEPLSPSEAREGSPKSQTPIERIGGAEALVERLSAIVLRESVRISRLAPRRALDKDREALAEGADLALWAMIVRELTASASAWSPSDPEGFANRLRDEVIRQEWEVSGEIAEGLRKDLDEEVRALDADAGQETAGEIDTEERFLRVCRRTIGDHGFGMVYDFEFASALRKAGRRCQIAIEGALKIQEEESNTLSPIGSEMGAPEKAIGIGILGTILMSLGTIVSTTFALWGVPQFSPSNADPWNYLDALNAVVFGIGLFLGIRTAAITLFAYYAITRFGELWSVGPTLDQLILLLPRTVFMLAFGAAVWGTIAFHRRRRLADHATNPRRMREAVFAGAILLVLFGEMVAEVNHVGLFGNPGIVRGHELTPLQSGYLRSEGIIDPNETVRYYYPYGPLAIGLEGVVLTNRRVIYYSRSGTRADLDWISYGEVSTVVLGTANGEDNAMEILLALTNGDHFYISLPKPDDRVLELFSFLEEQCSTSP